MIDLPRIEGGYGAILADPPWDFKTWSAAGRDRSPDRHYRTMSHAEIITMPVREIAAPNSVLFLWATWPMLTDALMVIGEWGYSYKTCAFAWIKADVRQADMFRDDADVSIGPGYWTRSNSEVCLLATRGKPKRLNADVRQGIIAPRREHSRKPDGIHERIERLVAGPYLELFARQSTRPGWTFWGNQTDKFGSAA